MTSWWNENLYPDCRQSFLIDRVLYDRKSRFQRIQILDTARFGRVLVLDGIVQTTDADEFIYHEMLVHPALTRHDNPTRVAVVGGGDGGAAREVLRWPCVEQLDLIEIDAEVISVSETYLPDVSKRAFADRRLKIRYEDGAKYLESAKDRYDVIIVDSSDPIGPSTALFSNAFYNACMRSLGTSGILVTQCGAPFLAGSQFRSAYESLCSCARHVAVYATAVPTYYGGSFAFLMATNDCSSLSKRTKLTKAGAQILCSSRHINRALNQHLLAIPTWQALMIADLRSACVNCGH